MAPEGTAGALLDVPRPALVVTQDGRQLYFCSNRPGGHGGFDLYVAERTGAGWGKPRNLGPKVNSPADEHDPAPSPDGLSLYFASNRNPKHDAMAEEELLRVYGKLPDPPADLIDGAGI